MQYYTSSSTCCLLTVVWNNKGQYSNMTHVSDRETQRGQVSCPRSYSKSGISSYFQGSVLCVVYWVRCLGRYRRVPWYHETMNSLEEKGFDHGTNNNKAYFSFGVLFLLILAQSLCNSIPILQMVNKNRALRAEILDCDFPDGNSNIGFRLSLL